MKKILNIAIVAFLALGIVSCKEDLGAGEGVPQIYVTGATTALPTDVKTYSVGDATGTFSWSASDATIASVPSSGSEVSVEFLKPGTVRISVSDGSQTGYIDVVVSSISAGVSVSYDTYGYLREDSTGTVTFKFDTPLAGAPKFGLDPKSTATLVDSLGDLEGSSDTYTVFMRGGTGDGTPNAFLRDVTVAENYGGDVADTIAVSLFTIDNTQPLLANVEVHGVENDGYVNWGDEVGLTFTFSEAMRTSMETPKDTAVWLYFEYDQIQDGISEEVLDSVEFTTEDMLTWSALYTVPDSIESGDDVDFYDIEGDMLDLAGNEFVFDPFAWLDEPSVEVDREGPYLNFSSINKNSDFGEKRLASSQEWVTIMSYYGDEGSGTYKYYYHIKEAYESDTTDAGVHNPGPKSLEDFTGEPIMAPDEDFDGPPYGVKSMLMSVDSAAYDMFWIAVDKLGNVSEEIDSVRFTFDVDGNLDCECDL